MKINKKDLFINYFFINKAIIKVLKEPKLKITIFQSLK